MKVATLAFLFFSTVSALCPNDCSGHGDCSASSHCTCYNNWMGTDCAQRVCTFGRAFIDSPWGDLDGDGALNPARAFSPLANFKVQGIDHVASNVGEMGFNEYGYARASRTTAWDEAHFYRECSNKGLCDRETGLCQCFPGYEGSGCRRTACANDCSGHGKCRTILESDRPDKTEYSAWDGEKTQLCMCDAGWSGPSCSQRSCPKGADPVLYNYHVTNSIQGIYFRTFAPDKNLVKTEEKMHDFLKDKPSKVFFTVTFTDEYDDEWTSSAMSIDYTTFCDSATNPTSGICVSTPTLNYNHKGATNALKNQDARVVLERLSENLNSSLLALPTDAIENSFVWSGGNPLKGECTGVTANSNNNLRADVTACAADAASLQLKPLTFQQYPWEQDANDANDFGPEKSIDGTSDDGSLFVDSLDYRLDDKVTVNVDMGSHTIDFDGTDTEVFGVGLFVKLPGPGVDVPLQVRFWYTPESTLNGQNVKYSVVEGTSTIGAFTTDARLFYKQELVVVQDLQPKREWKAQDGDASKKFSVVANTALPMCSNRGICDFESGICNCFSGYTGLRCDHQNAVTYSY